MAYEVSFVEECKACGEDIHWKGRMSQRPPCQNCQRLASVKDEVLIDETKSENIFGPGIPMFGDAKSQP